MLCLPAGGQQLHFAAEGVHILIQDRKAGCQLMAAEPLQQIIALLQRLEQVEAAIAAAGALAPVFFVEADHECRHGETLREPGGHNADDTLVPAVSGQYDGVPAQFGPLLQNFQTLRKNLLLNELALPVQVAQGLGEGCAVLGALGHQQLSRHLRTAHPARRVDARGQRKADGAGADELAFQPALPHQHDKTGAAGVGECAQTHGDDGAVFICQTHHVGHSADGGQIYIVSQRLTAPGFRCQRKAQLERYAHTGQLFKGIGAVRTMGVDHCGGIGQFVLAFVVVGDDDIHADAPGKIRLLEIGDAAVHAHQQPGPFQAQPGDGIGVQGVALGEPVRDVRDDFCALLGEVGAQKAGGGDAVHVVVAEYRDGLAPFNGEVNARHGFVHVPQEHRVVEQLRPGGEERSCLVPGMNAPSGQSQCGQSRNAAAAQRLLCGPVPGDGIPCFVFHFIFDLGRRSKKLNGRKEYY